MEKTKTIGTQGKLIHSQARELISNVLEFIKNEAKNGLTIPLTKFKERLLAATKISDKIYREITKEALQVKSGEKASFSSPSKRRKRNNPKSNVYEGEIETIRTIIHNYHVLEKKQPTLKGIRQKINESGIDFQGSLPTLAKIIKKMGFNWKKTTDNRSTLVESYDIRFKRVKYLRQLVQYQNEGRPIIFTDESYIHSTHCQTKSWTDDSEFTLKKPMSKGSRLIMVHAGGKEGFIKNGLLMFRSGVKSGDYHDDMNHANFMKWVKEALIPNFPPRGVLVVDNASYHNVVIDKDPTTATLKKEMVKWLVERNIPHNSTLTKVELYDIIKKHKNKNPKYVLDSEMAKYDFRVLRLPPYHPELNPIQKIWAQVKQYVAARNTTFKLEDVEKLAREKFGAIMPEEWEKVCTNVEKTVQNNIEKEHLLDQSYEDYSFTVNTEDSDEDYWLTDDEDELEDEENITGVNPL